MDSLAESIADFIRVRQLNIAVAILLSVMYLAYQYWGVMFKCEEEEDYRGITRKSRSRSRSYSRSRSRSNDHHYKVPEPKHGRRGRKPQRRCPDCSLCNFGE
ncbi:uncharacterized protein LOC114241707 [Bombyx mandarina]|uniref:Uncharacterized protein n=2 Tax=Bombyx TaxID=7090 RepID=A0A8R1WHF9_BOMMO|nr:uncharacterized protein LOC101745331 [Bombyx mori]XP_028028436.1 uncharacterized protein LOC114241707 [Bombyx mandarina]